MANPNPNEPNFPYSGGTDNPGDNTAIPGGPTDAQAVETAPLQPVPHVSGVVAGEGIHPGLVAGIPAQGSDTILPAGMQAVGPTAAGLEGAIPGRGADPEGGVDPVTGAPREAGQDETAGATETTSGQSPSAFPEPNP